MADKFNTIAGWTLFGGIVALGLSSVSSRMFEPHEPEAEGYAIEGVAEEGEAEQGPSLAVLLAEADPADGQKVFAKCLACHTIDQGAPNGIGANLWGVVGAPVGERNNGFAYSSAIHEVGGTWNFEQLDKWLASPRAFAPGTKMSFAGLSKPEDRAAVIAYLNSQGSNLPLPEVAAEPAAEEGEAATATEVEAPEATESETAG